MKLWLEGVGLLAPGLQGWAAGAPVLAGQAPYERAPTEVAASTLLPAAERRRAGLPVKLALAVGQEAFANAARDPGATATVFTSSSGDGENLHRICETLAGSEREISPTRFHNSVHNAPAGYWSIAVGAREASTSLCAHDMSFAAGLIDACAQTLCEQVAVALIACDQPYPEPLHGVRPIAGSVCVGMVLTHQATAPALAVLEVELLPADGAVTRMEEPQLEALRAGAPAARALPLLAAVARAKAQGASGVVDLEYTGALKMRVTVRPC